MFGLGIWELLIILTIVVLLFGAKRLPMIGDGIGKMINNFKKAKLEDPTLDANLKEDNKVKEDKESTVIEN